MGIIDPTSVTPGIVPYGRERFDDVCIALFKVSRAHSLEFPDPSVRVYVSGLVSRFDDPVYRESCRRLVVESTEDLKERLKKHQDKVSPSLQDRVACETEDDFMRACSTIAQQQYEKGVNVWPFFWGKTTGDFYLYETSLNHKKPNEAFLRFCYDVASSASLNIGYRTLAKIYARMSMNLGSNIALLSRFFDVRPVEINDEDYRKYRGFIVEEEKKARLEEARKVKVKANPAVPFSVIKKASDTILV